MSTETDRMFETLTAITTALEILDAPSAALDALDVLDAQSAALRKKVTERVNAAGHEPLANSLPINDGTGPFKIARPAMGADQHAIVDRRTRAAGH